MPLHSPSRSARPRGCPPSRGLGPSPPWPSPPPDDLHALPDPVRREVDPARVAALADELLDHFLAEHLELRVLLRLGHARPRSGGGMSGGRYEGYRRGITM